MKYILCILIGYCLGITNFAYIIGRLKGFDIRTKGSTNAGASNAKVVMGWKIGIIVAICDIMKAFIAVFLAKYFFPELSLAGTIAGVSCVIGHIFPFYMRFKGGKGFASFMGMVLAMDWKFFLVLAVLTIIITVLTNYIALATLSTVVIFPIYLLTIKADIYIPLIIGVASIVMIFKHIENIKRILKGNEIGLRKAK